MVLRTTLVSCVFLTAVFADTVYLRNGSSVEGSYAGGDTREVRMMVGDRIERYPIEDVQRVEFGGSGGARSAEPRRDTRDRDRERTDVPPETLPPQTQAPGQSGYSGMDLAAGTNIVVRMTDSVDSERDSSGKTFRASVDEPVMVNGQTVIPRGADVIVKLVDAKESGKFAGKTSLTLNLMQVQINGRMVDVSSSEVTQASGSRGARTAKTVGGGAAAGAVLGGIFGGGKGAAIGAASGGTLGAGAEVLTKGQRVKIPSETRLSFLLQQPLRI